MSYGSHHWWVLADSRIKPQFGVNLSGQGFIFRFHVTFRGCDNFVLVQAGPLPVRNGVK